MSSAKDKQLPIPQRELWRAAELGAILGCSTAQIYLLNKAEALPAPVTIHKGMAWRAAEIRDWLAADCPDRGAWRWTPTLPQKLDDLIQDRHRQLRGLDEELKRKRWELSRNQALLNEADR